MTTTSRLTFKDELSITKNVISRYRDEKIKPVLDTFPMPGLFFWDVRDKISDLFEAFVLSKAKQWLKAYPDLSYQQLQQKAVQPQLSYQERQDIEQCIRADNQKALDKDEVFNQRIKEEQKKAYKAYLRHPFKNTRPDKDRYRLSSFSISDSPFTVSTVLEALGQVFQGLRNEKIRHDKEQNFNHFADRPHIQGDKDQLTLHNQLNTESVELRQEYQQAESKQYDLKVKQAELKRKLEQLKHLSQIAQGYSQLPDANGLTSPAEQIEALEKLLAEKRRR